MSTAMPAVHAALAALFAAALPGVAIYNGPPVTASSDPDLVLVGDDGDPESDAASSFEQEWADIAATSRYERGSVVCGVIAQSGDTDIPARAARVGVLMAACETALRANPTLADLVLGAQFSSGSTRPLQNDAGSVVIGPFAISYIAQV